MQRSSVVDVVVKGMTSSFQETNLLSTLGRKLKYCDIINPPLTLYYLPNSGIMKSNV